ncbi:MAG: hypothetical protein AAF514_02435, partial [Verrucomicrobiota bacterium]
MAGSATSMFVYNDMDAHSYIIKPLFWLGVYGCVPAGIMGMIETAIIRALNKTGEQVSAGNQLEDQ